jgi:hypothetical protein
MRSLWTTDIEESKLLNLNALKKFFRGIKVRLSYRVKYSD